MKNFFILKLSKETVNFKNFINKEDLITIWKTFLPQPFLNVWIILNFILKRYLFLIYLQTKSGWLQYEKFFYL